MTPPPGTASAPWAALIVLVGWVLASLLYRKIQGKPLVYKRLEGTKFRQTNASGHSHRSWLTRLGGANRCLVVQVTERELDIHPYPPFNWFFLPEIYGLEFRVPLTDIRSAQLRKRIIRQYVEVSFRTDRGDETVSLLLSRAEDFLRALGVPPGRMQPPEPSPRR